MKLIKNALNNFPCQPRNASGFFSKIRASHCACAFRSSWFSMPKLVKFVIATKWSSSIFTWQKQITIHQKVHKTLPQSLPLPLCKTALHSASCWPLPPMLACIEKCKTSPPTGDPKHFIPYHKLIFTSSFSHSFKHFHTSFCNIKVEVAQGPCNSAPFDVGHPAHASDFVACFVEQHICTTLIHHSWNIQRKHVVLKTSKKSQITTFSTKH